MELKININKKVTVETQRPFQSKSFSSDQKLPQRATKKYKKKNWI